MCTQKPKEKYIHHDAWIYRIAGCTHSAVIYDEKSYMLYGQHGDNVIGKAEYWNPKKAIHHILAKRNHVLESTYVAIYEQFADKLNDEAKDIVPVIANYRKSIIAKGMLCLWKVPYSIGFKTGIIWNLKVILNGI